VAIAYKNKNVDKVAAAEKELNEIRTALVEKAANDEKIKWLLDNLNAKMAEGELAGIQKAINMVQNAINNDPAEFIRSLFRDLKPDSSYSSLNDVYHELQRGYAAKNTSKEQEQIFIDDIAQEITLGNVKNVVAWMTMINRLNEYVLKPASEKGSTAPDEAKKILQDALNKLNASNVQTQGSQPEEQPNTQAQGSGEEQKQSTAIMTFAEGVATSELLSEMSKREEDIKKFIASIEKADTKLLQKANAAILQFSAESQAILNKVVDLSDGEKGQLQKLQEQLNRVVEEKAKELKVGTKTLTVSGKHLKATEEHIDNLMKRKEEEYREVITNYHNTVIKILAEEFNIPEESIDETLEERISRHTALGRSLRNRSKGESESPNTAKGFDIKSLDQNKQ